MVKTTDILKISLKIKSEKTTAEGNGSLRILFTFNLPITCLTLTPIAERVLFIVLSTVDNSGFGFLLIGGATLRQAASVVTPR